MLERSILRIKNNSVYQELKSYYSYALADLYLPQINMVVDKLWIFRQMWLYYKYKPENKENHGNNKSF